MEAVCDFPLPIINLVNPNFVVILIFYRLLNQKECGCTKLFPIEQRKYTFLKAQKPYSI